MKTLMNPLPSFLLLVILLALTVVHAAASSSSDGKENKVDIKERLRQFREPSSAEKAHAYKYLNDRHESRIQKLADLLEERKMQMEHHQSGHRKLSQEDHERVSRQIVNFDRKLTQLKQVDPEEHKDMLSHEAESLYRMNSVDYLDFTLKN